MPVRALTFTVATVNVLHGRAPWRLLAVLVGWQEADKKTWTQRALAAARKAGHALFVPGGAAARAVTTSWDTDRFTSRATGAVMTHRGLKGISPHRWIAYNFLDALELDDDETLLHLNTHMVSGVRRKKAARYFWRLARWYRHDVILSALVAIALGRTVQPPDKNYGWWKAIQPDLIRFRALVAKHQPDHVVVTGDYNQVPTKTRVPGLNVVWSRHSKGIDQIHFSPSLRVTSTRQGDKDGSDHPPFIAEMTTAPAPNPPTPPKPKPEPEDPVNSIDDLTRRVIARARSLGGDVHTHEQWGSQCRDIYAARLRTRPVRVKKADTLAAHITVTRDDGPLTGDFYADMREVERIGKERFGSGFSYNWGVENDKGLIGVGQPLLAKGTHTVNNKKRAGYSYDQNHAARAYAWLGMPGQKLSAAARRSFVILEAAMILEGALTADPDLLPHSFFAAKDCPTGPLRDALPGIHRDALALVAKVRRDENKPDPDKLELPRYRIARKFDVVSDEAFAAGAKREAALGHAAAQLVRDGKVRP